MENEEKVKYLGMMLTPKAKDALEWVIDILAAFIIAIIVLCFFRPTVVNQESMVPTFKEKDNLILARQAYRFGSDVERGDVIVFSTNMQTEAGTQKNLIKRVIALPGEVISAKDGYVYINSKKIDEPYLNEQGVTSDFEPIVVPDGKVFVMGDNRAVSLDSRAFGSIDKENIMGRVIFRIFPLKKIGKIERIEY